MLLANSFHVFFITVPNCFLSFPFLIPALFVGHLFSAFFNYKNEKVVFVFLGIAYSIGFLFGVYLTIIWLFSLIVSKTWSLGTIFMMLCAPFISWIMFQDKFLTIDISLLTLLAFYFHRINIHKIWKGEEPVFVIK